MKKLLVLALAAIIAASPSVHAQDPTSSTVVFKYNLNSLTEIFCSLGPQFTIGDRVQSAASTTYTAVAGSPFANVAVGDMITGADLGGSPTYVKAVHARASAASITVNTAIAPETNPTLTNATVQARTLSCGTGVNSGAFDVSRYAGFTVQIDIQQMVLAVPGTSSIDARILCRSGGQAQWLQAYPILVPPAVTPSYVSSTVVGGWAVELNGRFSECRVGLKINAADDGGDTGTNAEQVTVSIHGTVIS